MTGAARPSLAEAYAGPVTLPPLTERAEMLGALASGLYGPMPSPPADMTLDRTPLPTSRAERLVLTLTLPRGTVSVDAALWLPDGPGPFPVIVGLDFIGPAGILPDRDFPLDPRAVIVTRPEFGGHDGTLTDSLRGTSAINWPVSLLTAQGYAVLISCYGSWVPDHRGIWDQRGVAPRIAETCGAITLWAWALARLIDAASRVPQIDAARVAVAGHSRLGKAALWAAANDDRISAVLASSSGAAGAAPARHPVGETLEQLRGRFPHWLLRPGSGGRPATDQHALLALAHPAAVYLAGAEDDLWADPLGSYLALVAASAAWADAPEDWPDPQALWHPGARVVRGALGFHLRAGGHALLPHDWHGFLEFLRGQWAAAPRPEHA